MLFIYLNLVSNSLMVTESFDVKMSVNKDIAVERENCNFNIEDFTSWYHDGVEKLEKKRFLGNL